MSKLKIITWNVRGLGRTEKIRVVARLVSTEKPSFLLLQETKLNVCRTGLRRKLGANFLRSCSSVSSDGSAGGLMCLWNEDLFEVSSEHKQFKFMALTRKFKLSNFDCVIINVYGPLVDADKEEFFREFLCFVSSLTVPVCIGGILMPISFLRRNVDLLITDEEGFAGVVENSIANARIENESRGIFSLLEETKLAIRNYPRSNLRGFSLAISELETKINGIKLKFQSGGISAQEREVLDISRKELWILHRKEETLKVGGVVISDPEQLRGHIYDYFKAVYTSNSTLEVEDMDLNFAKLSHDQMKVLERKFAEQEVWEAVFQSDSSKSSGPDGFTMGFFKKFWPNLKVFIMKFVEDFYNGRNWEHGVNHAFITLIPKIRNPKSIEDYRPISLVGSLYKIISKVLSRRLVSVNKDVISPSQFAFIPGRQLHECAFLANEAIDYWRKKGRKCVFKVDFRRAYDSMEWPILLRLMKVMGFGDKWISWIKFCISSASISVLVNGSPIEEFKMGKGLRQGCSLSLLLFNIVGELLNLMLVKAAACGLFEGFSIGREDNLFILTHLQFADDLIIFCRDSPTQILNIRRVLNIFSLMSGLSLNLSKSKLYGVNLEDELLKEWASVVGCGMGALPMTYLGLPIGTTKNSELLWEPVIQNFSTKLAGWKASSLSLAGRLVLVKSVLSSLPIFFMPIFKIPPKGGLGVLDLSLINRVLLGKWVWKFANEKESQWKNMLCCKHNISNLSLSISTAVSSQDSWTWRGIRNNYERKDEIGDCLRSNSKLQVGSGRSIAFWNDVWWMVDDFLAWSGKGDGLFSAKSCRLTISGSTRGNFQWSKWVWSGLVPPRVQTFLWQLSHHKVAVRVELKKRGVPLENVLCPLCLKDEETIQHLFLLCPVVRELWNRFLRLWDVLSVLPKDPQSFLCSWSHFMASSSIWKFIPGVVLWSTWKARNYVVFENGNLDMAVLFFISRFRLAKWLLAKYPQANIQFDLLGGIGGILKDSNGSDLISFSTAVGPGPPMLAELKAIKEGIDLFLSSQWAARGRLVLESDCSTVLEWILRPVTALLFSGPSLGIFVP
ncbi:uncharacterized protein LOC120162494 [Hibiscus syriacus]|uniref:uncharacterized protein LOC120162494 n=1 Tax=Hibiscus syriacus TaxID=106335 RepID=UPI0019222CAD|nr:uncharacterized protein LOC120162494 [Hibiscus syriacus]